MFVRGTAEALPVADRAVTVAWAISSAHHWAGARTAPPVSLDENGRRHPASYHHVAAQRD